jgi:phosphoribosylglycinamide formyltransferase-1
MNGVVLISGGGSNLQSIIDSAEKINLSIQCVVSNRPNVYGLERATKANIPNCVLDHKLFESRENFDQALMSVIDEHQPDVVILAGFMRILTDEFINKYQGRMLNIHPSLLPKYPGLNTHQQVIDAGDTLHGASVHFVTKTLDGGPVIAQKEVKINPEESAETLAERVLRQEHVLFPKVIHWYTQGRLKLLNDTIATLDGQVI